MLAYAGAPDVAGTLQKWAAIISKTASDTVAGVHRRPAPTATATSATACATTRSSSASSSTSTPGWSLLYPEVQTFAVLQRDPEPNGHPCAEARDFEKIIIIHALDLLYFWMYQPRARTALGQFVQTLSEDERHILASSQFILQRHREISQIVHRRHHRQRLPPAAGLLPGAVPGVPRTHQDPGLRPGRGRPLRSPPHRRPVAGRCRLRRDRPRAACARRANRAPAAVQGVRSRRRLAADGPQP